MTRRGVKFGPLPGHNLGSSLLHAHAAQLESKDGGGPGFSVDHLQILAIRRPPSQSVLVHGGLTVKSRVKNTIHKTMLRYLIFRNSQTDVAHTFNSAE